MQIKLNGEISTSCIKCQNLIWTIYCPVYNYNHLKNSDEFVVHTFYEESKDLISNTYIKCRDSKIKGQNAFAISFY